MDTNTMAKRLATRWLQKTAGDEAGQEVLRQLGGTGRLSAMIGAKHFLVGVKERGSIGGATFQFPRPGSGKPNVVKILVMPDDTYTVEFGSAHGYNYKVLKTVNDIYVEQLKPLFERTTGLRLSLR